MKWLLIFVSFSLFSSIQHEDPYEYSYLLLYELGKEVEEEQKGFEQLINNLIDLQKDLVALRESLQ